MTPKTPPATLGCESRRLWRELNGAYLLEKPQLMTLRVALEAYDRLLEAQAIIAREGLIYETETKYKRAHPALAIEKAARDGFLRAWASLDWDVEPPLAVGRPPMYSGPQAVSR